MVVQAKESVYVCEGQHIGLAWEAVEMEFFGSSCHQRRFCEVEVEVAAKIQCRIADLARVILTVLSRQVFVATRQWKEDSPHHSSNAASVRLAFAVIAHYQRRLDLALTCILGKACVISPDPSCLVSPQPLIWSCYQSSLAAASERLSGFEVQSRLQEQQQSWKERGPSFSCLFAIVPSTMIHLLR